MKGWAGAAIALLWAAGLAETDAALPKQWQLGSGVGWIEGTLQGTEVDAEGRLVLAPRADTLWGPGEGILWDLAPDGEGVFVALSDPGRLLRLGPGERIATWYAGGEDTLVTAVTGDGRGGAYFATAPDGRLWHVAGPEAAEVFAETGASFVWALVREGDTLWAATGQPGMLLRVEAGKEPEPVAKTGDDPLRCLGRVGAHLVAGTGTRGRVLRIDPRAAPQERVFVLFDAEAPEIVAVTGEAGGGILALALEERRTPPSPAEPRAERVVVRAEGPAEPARPQAAPQQEPAPERPAPTRRAGAAVLYRLAADGDVRELWRAGETPYALSVDRDGMIRVGTGDRGHVYRLDAQGRTRSVMRVASDTVTALRVDARGELWIGAARDARVVRIGRRRAQRGGYRTQPVDAGWVARWGRLSWDASLPAGTKLEVRARAGNTEEPDETWTPWQEIEAGPAGASLARLPLTRRLQLELTLVARSGDSPAVRSVRVYYQPVNRAPRIEKLEIQPPGIAWRRTRTQSSLTLGPLAADDPVAREAQRQIHRGPRPSGAIRKAYELGARTFAWEAEDPDGDPLRFRLEVRREGDSEWFPLAVDLEESFYTWDTRAVPDGRYRVRLVADDTNGNPPGAGREARWESEPFEVDHTPPRIEPVRIVPTKGGVRLEFEAVDSGGAVAAAEYALGDGPWVPVYPVDGVADSERERYRVTLEPAPGARALRLRVTDRLGNVGGRLERLP